MKDFLRQILSSVESQILGRCIVREYLQARLLQSLQDRGTFNTWVFQGGTALRFLYGHAAFFRGPGFRPCRAGDGRQLP